MRWKFFTVLVLSLLFVVTIGINFVSADAAYDCATGAHWWNGFNCVGSPYTDANGCVYEVEGSATLLTYLTSETCSAGQVGYQISQDTQATTTEIYPRTCSGLTGNPNDYYSSCTTASTPTVSLSVWPGYSTTNVNYGSYKLLQWSSTGTSSCSASWTSDTGPSGSGSAGPATSQPTVTYSISCTGSGGTASDSLTFTVDSVNGDGYCTSGETCSGGENACCITPLCGNGVTDNSGGATETCDFGNSSTPPPNNGDVCTLNYGDRYCTYCSTSCQLTNNTANAKYCGDGFVTNGEQCDGSNLNGTTCQSLGYQSGGPLTCYPASASNPSQNCTFNTANCVNYAVPPGGAVCGNSLVESGEQCDTGSSRGACPATCSTSCTSNNCAPPAQTCNLTSATWSTTNTTEGNTVSLQVQGTSACSGQTVSFVVKEYDAGSTDDPVQTNPVNVVFSGNLATGSWVIEWQDDGPLGGNPEYYFTATVSGVGSISSSTSGNQLLSVTQNDVFQCNQITTCSDYTDVETCTLDQCRVVDNSVPGQVDCGAGSGTGCVCFWDEVLSSCRAKTEGAAGSCVYTQSTADDCGDGFLIFSWTALWTWGEGKTLADDTDGLSLACVDGSKTVECPSQIALPFFSMYNIVVILVAIALIYWAMAMRKSKKKTSSRKKRI